MFEFEEALIKITLLSHIRLLIYLFLEKTFYISYTNNIFIYIILLNNLITFYDARKQKEQFYIYE